MKAEQPNFNFEGEPAYNVPQHIKEPAAFDEVSFLPEGQELHQNADGTFTNEAGDVFKKVFKGEAGGFVYELSSSNYSPEMQDLMRELRDSSPGISEAAIISLAREKLQARRRRERTEALEALKKKK